MNPRETIARLLSEALCPGEVGWVFENLYDYGSQSVQRADGTDRKVARGILSCIDKAFNCGAELVFDGAEIALMNAELHPEPGWGGRVVIKANIRGMRPDGAGFTMTTGGRKRTGTWNEELVLTLRFHDVVFPDGSRFRGTIPLERIVAGFTVHAG